LKKHLFPRVLTRVCSGKCVDLQALLREDDWPGVVLAGDRLYPHSLARIKYTTYDVRRDEDILHPTSNRPNVMVLNPDFDRNSQQVDARPFRFAKVIQIYHADVSYAGTLDKHGLRDDTSYRLDFLCVRWYKLIPSQSPYELDQAELLDLRSDDAIGFLDPGDVVRVCHIIPRYALGLAHSQGHIASTFANDGTDWKAYFINQ
jgi:hypothetical protein